MRGNDNEIGLVHVNYNRKKTIVRIATYHQQTHINIPRSSIKRSMAERLAKIWFITTKKNAPTLKLKEKAFGVMKNNV